MSACAHGVMRACLGDRQDGGSPRFLQKLRMPLSRSAKEGSAHVSCNGASVQGGSVALDFGFAA